MSASAPWSVKGIDAKAREVAKDLARRSGMTLGEWLNQMILQGEDVGALINRERERDERPAPQAQARPVRRIPEAAYADEDDGYDDEAYDERYAPRGQRQPAPRQPVYRETAYREQADRAPVYNDGPRTRRPELRNEIRVEPRAERAAPFSSGARPLASRELRRGSIFEGRPRVEDYEEQNYAAASDDLNRVARALEGLGSRIETSESRSANAVRSVSSAVESLLGRLERSEAAHEQTRDELSGRLEEQSREVLSTFEQFSRRNEEERRQLELDRRQAEEDRQRAEADQGLFAERLEQAERLIDAQAERLEGLSGHLREERERMARIETGLKSTQTVDTIKAVEGALGKLANQMYETEVRSRETVKDIREDMLGLSHRLVQMELRDPEREAQALIDKVVTKLAQRLESAESQTGTAIKTLEAAFRNLEGRLSRAEERGDVSDPEAARSLSQLASELSRRVEENRQEMLNALQAGSREGIDKAVSRFEGRLEQAERRSAAAIERMGQEVFRMADAMNRRVASVEEANSAGMTRLGAEVARIAEAVETRSGRNESSHAQALERLGGEIARISERLNAKMAESERRTVQVLGEVGERLEQQREHVRADLGERIRQSEERTAKLLDEARSRIDSKLAQVQTQSLLSEAAVKAPRPDTRQEPGELPSAFAPAPAPAAEIESKPFSQFSGGFDSDDVDADDEADAAPPLRAQTAARVQPRAEPAQGEQVDLTGRLLNSVTDFKPEFDPFDGEDDEDFSAELMNSPLSRNPRAQAQNQGVTATAEEDDPFAEIETSRKTAPRPETRAQAYSARTAPPPSVQAFDDEDDAGVSVSTRDALAAARAAVRASMEGDDKPLGNLRAGVSRSATAKAPAPKGSGESTLMKAFKASSLAVLLAGGMAGGALVINKSMEKSGKTEKAGEGEATPIAAAVITPDLGAEDTSSQANLKARYDLAMEQIQARKPGAVDVLKEVANQGYPMAQYRLSRIYAGEGSLTKINNLEARRWTQRAAEGGVTQAMFYLGMQYYNGEGGGQDRSTAAMWFRKAAERGDNDSQFNLGLLYKDGVGVPLNPTEAYKWLSLAGRSGDKSAVAEAAKVKGQLNDVQLQKANDAIDRFTPISDNAPPLTSSTSAG